MTDRFHSGGSSHVLRSSFLFLALIICANACNFRGLEAALPTPDADNIIYVTATPRPFAIQAAPSETPTEMPAAAPTAPGIDAAHLLQSGENLARNGYLEEAAGIYRSLLNYGDAVGPQDRALARFRLGQVALRAGFFEQALDSFTLFIDEFPDDRQLARAYFLRADARLGLSQWGAAIADLQQYLALRPSLIDSYVYERIADAQIALGQTEGALEQLRARDKRQALESAAADSA